MLDICWRCDKDNKINYVWFDTGLEYVATKEHLKFLEQKYRIEIKAYKALKPIPVTCKTEGQPFISKRVSEMLSRLQRNGFQWEDETLDVLLKRYCKWDEKRQDWVGCKVALYWWCNANTSIQFCIDYNKWLKEFIVQNPIQFKVSNRCCNYSKKDVIHRLLKEEKYDLNISGVRRVEGGARAIAYKNCFDQNVDECDNYRPLFWYSNSDKAEYEAAYGVVHSRCYTEYGLLRTGCAGCPFGRDFEMELSVIQQYEPKLLKAVNNIFGDSYSYTRAYREFFKSKKQKDVTK